MYSTGGTGTYQQYLQLWVPLIQLYSAGNPFFWHACSGISVGSYGLNFGLGRTPIPRWKAHDPSIQRRAPGWLNQPGTGWLIIQTANHACRQILIQIRS